MIPPSNEPIIPSNLILAPIQWDIMTEITEAQISENSPPECPLECTYVPLSICQRV